MSVDREELKRLIDLIEEDAIKVYDFISYLNMKRESESINQTDLNALSEDKSLLRQIQQSREDRKNKRIYEREQGLDYLQKKIKEDIEANPKIKQKLLRAKQDILNGYTYTTDEVLQMIEQEEV